MDHCGTCQHKYKSNDWTVSKWSCENKGFGLFPSLPSEYSLSQWHLLPQSQCGGESQWLINIETRNALTDKHLDAFTYTNFDDKRAIMSIVNTGHTGFSFILWAVSVAIFSFIKLRLNLCMHINSPIINDFYNNPKTKQNLC